MPVRSLLGAIFVVIPMLSIGQMSLHCTIDSNTMLIGDQRDIQLIFKSNAPTIPDTVSFEGWRELGVEPVTGQRWQQHDPTTFSQVVRIAAFDTGYIKLPPLILPIDAEGSSDTILSNTLAIEVNAIAVDSSGLAPLKPILREPFSIRDIIPYLIAFSIGALLIAIYLFRKNKSKPQPVNIEIPIPPDERALEELRLLREKKLWQQGKIKDYQSELTHIIRSYLEERYEMPALESTTTEILNTQRIKTLEKGLMGDLSQILNIADLIKFAKAKPEIDLHERFMKKAEHFIIATREVKKLNDD